MAAQQDYTLQLPMPAWLRNLENNFDLNAVMNWHNSHVEVPVFALAIYLFFIFQVPDLVKKPFNLKPLLMMWNLSLAVYSIYGAFREVPALWHLLSVHGFDRSVCGTLPPDQTQDFLTGPVGFWMMLFIYSKFFELLDTVFLVLHKRPVIFLHWFHHVTVLAYCWHAYAEKQATGLWFAAMNYSVHSIMYLYYFLMLFRSFRKCVRPIGPFITTIQIAQMVGGIIVSSHAALAHSSNPASCGVASSNYRLGLAMYICYFALFAALFYDKNLRDCCSSKPRVRGGSVPICNATDATSCRGVDMMTDEMRQNVSSSELKGLTKNGKESKNK